MLQRPIKPATRRIRSGKGMNLLMTTESLAISYTALAVLIFIFLLLALRTRQHREGNVYFVFLCLSFLLWLVCMVLFYMVPDERLALLFHELRFSGVAFVAVFFYLFVLKSLKYDNRTTIRLVLYLSIVPLITTLICLTEPYHTFMRAQLSLIIVNGYRTIDYEYGFWFWVHLFYCYVLLLFASIELIQNHIVRRAGFRQPTFLMLLAVIFTVAFNILYVLQLWTHPFDITTAGVLFSILFFYWSLFRYEERDYVLAARHQIFNALPQLLIILNSNRLIVDYNAKAEAVFQNLASALSQNFDIFLEDWLAQRTGRRTNLDDESYLFFQEDKITHCFHITERTLSAMGRILYGYIVILCDASAMHQMLENVRLQANHDTLTGMNNRRAFYTKSSEIDEEAALGTALIIADIDRLKYINDTWGHAQGDRILCAAAQIVMSVTPPEALAARVGGDEFAILFPQMSFEGLLKVAAAIEEQCRQIFLPDGSAFTMSLGCAQKTSPSQKVSHLLEEADFNMYLQKRNRTPYFFG